MTASTIRKALDRVLESGLRSHREAYVILLLGEKKEMTAQDLMAAIKSVPTIEDMRGLCAILRNKGILKSRNSDFKSHHSLTPEGGRLFALLTKP